MTKKIALMNLVGFAAVGGLVAGPASATVSKTQTQTQLAFQPAPDKNGQQGQGVGAVVSPSPPAGEKVVVKYFKRKNGQWMRLGVHRPKLNSQGVAETAFYPKVKHGTCKLTGRYPGDNKYDASKGKMVYDCATGEPKS